MKIVFVVGSLRFNSFNGQLAKRCEELLKDKAEITYLDYTLLPFMNQDIEFPAPEEVTKVREIIKETDGIYFFTPEYNGSYPGALKNLIDWLSRPLEPGKYDTVVIRGKKVAIAGVAGKSAAANSRSKLKELLTGIKCDVLKEEVGIPIPPASWQSDVLTLTDEQVKELEKQCELFMNFVGL